MPNTLRFGSALSVIAVATLTGGCAGPMERAGRSNVGAIDMAKVGLGTRAQAALAAQDYATAVDLAEQAVANKPEDAGLRTLLGNAYFASGRFASAEAAYRDSLSVFAAQPQVALKLALVQIAQGRNAEAVSFLQSARGNLNASDYGLALALAGQPADAVMVLEAAARSPSADSQLRQNLALAHGLAGDWTAARVVAAQDLSPDLVDARVQQWMTFAKPNSASDQVAALVGIKPAASDPGQPVQLALRSTDARTASVEPSVVAPTPVAPLPDAPATVAAIEVPPAVELSPTVAQSVAVAADAGVAEMPSVAAAFTADVGAADPAPAYEAPKAPVLTEAASLPAPLRTAAMPRSNGQSAAVVQLGAFGSSDGVGRAWNAYAGKYGALRDYTPVSARFASSKGTVYRLSVKGFSSIREAQDLCASLRRAGGNCFVRNVAGDAPVRIASR